MKVALIHYWLTGMRGGEKVLEALCQLFPQADIFTHVYEPQALSPLLRKHNIQTTFVGRLPLAARWYKAYLPLMPMALESLDLTAYDLVISSESGPAKAVITRPDALHLCYCHSPMRYLWDLNPLYRQNMSKPARWLFAPMAHYLRMTDVLGATRVDHFVANSTFVQKRIKKFYRRESQIIHPPVNTDFFSALPVEQGDFYLVAGQLVAYKNVGLAIAACSQLGLPLVVVGQGPEQSKLAAMAGNSVRFTGRVDDEQLRHLMSTCKALIFPGVEDFGLVPVEAMACGKPVLAFQGGGVLDTIIPGQTGIFFKEQNVAALQEVLQQFEAQAWQFDSQVIQEHAAQFGTDVFMYKMQNYLHTLGWPG